MKAIRILINSNIFISLSAVALTIATQIQLGLNPEWHPYLFLIFFATIFEYNLHRLITVLTNSDALNSDKHNCVKDKLNWFYLLVFFSVLGFAISVIEAKLKVLLTLAPIAGLTLLYSTPLSKNAKVLFRLRQIPYLKIFLISFVWATVTILLPVIHSEKAYNNFHILTMIIERFLFVFAITIPFDIRDMNADSQTELKTIPLLIGEKRSIYASIIVLVLFFAVAVIHYSITNQWFILGAFSVSFLTTIVFLTNERIRNLPLYYYGILDGTMLLQGVLVLGFHYINFNF